MNKMKCPKCNRNFDSDSKPAISVELLGECLDCRRVEMTRKDIDAILAEQKRRFDSYREGAEQWAD